MVRKVVAYILVHTLEMGNRVQLSVSLAYDHGFSPDGFSPELKMNPSAVADDGIELLSALTYCSQYRFRDFPPRTRFNSSWEMLLVPRMRVVDWKLIVDRRPDADCRHEVLARRQWRHSSVVLFLWICLHFLYGSRYPNPLFFETATCSGCHAPWQKVGALGSWERRGRNRERRSGGQQLAVRPDHLASATTVHCKLLSIYYAMTQTGVFILSMFTYHLA